MVSRRVVIGKYADGATYGMKVALPGFDALSLDDNSGSLSFNSTWTDVVKVWQSGFITKTTNVGFPQDISVADPGYVPYAEIRKFSGSTINDDNVDGDVGLVGTRGYYRIRSPLTFSIVDQAAGFTALYVMFAIPVILS